MSCGVFGPSTEAAVKAYQTAHQMVSDGIVAGHVRHARRKLKGAAFASARLTQQKTQHLTLAPALDQFATCRLAEMREVSGWLTSELHKEPLLKPDLALVDRVGKRAVDLDVRRSVDESSFTEIFHGGRALARRVRDEMFAGRAASEVTRSRRRDHAGNRQISLLIQLQHV